MILDVTMSQVSAVVAVSAMAAGTAVVITLSAVVRVASMATLPVVVRYRKLVCHFIRKEKLFRINQVYYLRSFCSAHGHYKYLQLINLIRWKEYSSNN